VFHLDNATLKLTYLVRAQSFLHNFLKFKVGLLVEISLRYYIQCFCFAFRMTHKLEFELNPELSGAKDANMKGDDW